MTERWNCWHAPTRAKTCRRLARESSTCAPLPAWEKRERSGFARTTKRKEIHEDKNQHYLPAFAVFAFACFALSPQARAICQGGCLTNFNTVLGEDALNVNAGSANTAIGYTALLANTTGGNNTATGTNALEHNTTGSGNTATGVNALFQNSTAINNTALGFQTLVLSKKRVPSQYILLQFRKSGISEDNTK